MFIDFHGAFSLINEKEEDKYTILEVNYDSIVSKDHLLTTHAYNDIYKIESRPSYRSPLCISVIKSEHIYQVRWHFFLKTQGTSIACVFRKQNMFIKLQLLMSLLMNQFI